MANFELLEPGQIVDRYQVLCELGRGGMAAVYAVRLSSPGGIDKLLALKLLLPHLRAEGRFQQMFFEEARVAAQLDNTYLPHVFEAGTHRGAPYLVMERLVGVSLGDLLTQRIEHDVLAGLFAQLADALHALHCPVGAPRVVHRDVSPENVFVGRDGHVRLLDLGVAKSSDRGTLTKTGEVRGKLQYLAPEQITQSAQVSSKVDVWALGVIIWEAFSGRSLFKASEDPATLWNVTSMDVPLLTEVTPGIAQLVARCLERDPLERPDAYHVAENLRQYSAPSGAKRVRALIEDHFGSRLEAERERLDSACSALDRFAPGSSPSPHNASEDLGSLDADVEVTDVERTAEQSAPVRDRKRARANVARVQTPSHRRPANVLAILVIGGATVVALLFGGQPSEQASEGTPTASVPEERATEVQGASVSASSSADLSKELSGVRAETEGPKSSPSQSPQTGLRPRSTTAASKSLTVSTPEKRTPARQTQPGLGDEPPDTSSGGSGGATAPSDPLLGNPY